LSCPYVHPIYKMLCCRSKFTNLQSFLDAYHVGETVLQTQQDFEVPTWRHSDATYQRYDVLW
jgi:hypothetical protein